MQAAYFAGWTEGHEERSVLMRVSIGDWSEGTSGADRRSFALDLRAPEGEMGMMVTEHDFKDEPESLGRAVPREEALASDEMEDVWHVADHVVIEDPRVAEAMEWLRRGSRRHVRLWNRLRGRA